MSAQLDGQGYAPNAIARRLKELEFHENEGVKRLGPNHIVLTNDMLKREFSLFPSDGAKLREKQAILDAFDNELVNNRNSMVKVQDVFRYSREAHSDKYLFYLGNLVKSHFASIRKAPGKVKQDDQYEHCLLYTSPSPRDKRQSRMPSSA